MNNSTEIGSDLIVGDGVACSAFIQADSQELLQQLVLVDVIIIQRHLRASMEVDELGMEPGRRRRGNGENPNEAERKWKESVSCGVEIPVVGFQI